MGQVGQSHNQRHLGGRPSPRVHHRSRAWLRQPLARGQPGHLALHCGGKTCKLPVLEARHEGWYVCSTSHRLGNFSSVGYYLSVKQGAGLHRTTTLSGRVVVEADGSAPLCREADGAQLQAEVVQLLRENNQLQEEKGALEKRVVDLKGLVAGKM